MKKNLALTIVVCVVGALFVGGVLWATVKVVYRDHKIESEIDALKQQENAINTENKTLQQQIAFQQSPAAQEMLAKQKLDMQKNGESVAVIKPDTTTPSDETVQSSQETAQTKTDPNYKKWWNYFFAYQQ